MWSPHWEMVGGHIGSPGQAGSCPAAERAALLTHGARGGRPARAVDRAGDAEGEQAAGAGAAGTSRGPVRAARHRPGGPSKRTAVARGARLVSPALQHVEVPYKFAASRPRYTAEVTRGDEAVTEALQQSALLRVQLTDLYRVVHETVKT